MKTKSLKEKQEKVFDALKTEFGYKSTMQTPKVTKVVVSCGTGSQKDKNKNKIIVSGLEKITGQKAVLKVAKKSIATFKVREGDPVGYQITLRGKRMYDFLDKLVYVAFPRTKDFRGLSSKGIDEMGNFSIGIKENSIFPETADVELKDVFGFAATIVTTAHSKKEAKAYFDFLGFPFKKEESKK
ncbi:MAG: 50S ribosomal protein L5 [Candidatus Paceibacterota bacterium]|jgi:large subunit ribosomal protein L5